MKPYLALIKIDLKLAYRQPVVIFFTYLFPLLFFFGFAELLRVKQGGTISYVVSMVLVLGILGNGLFGAGMRTVQERDNNILRRFRVAPITPTPLLVASTFTGWLIYMPAVLLILLLAHFIYEMPAPDSTMSLLVLVSLGVMSFRAIGLIVASVVNSMQESNIFINLLYLPMLLLSGATFPITLLPEAAQYVAQFVPASYLVTGFQGIFLRGESLRDIWPSAAALAITLVVGLFLSRQLFRWDKEEKIRQAAKLWVLAVLAPFFLLGSYHIYSREHIKKAEALWRSLQRSEKLLIRDARIFTGDGRVIESGSVLIENGKIGRVYEDEAPDPGQLNAMVIEAYGKNLLPGLIDMHVHLAAPGGSYSEPPRTASPEKAMGRALASYLYCGITAVKSVGDPLGMSLSLREEVGRAERLGAELFACGPLFTTPGGHGTEYLKDLPDPWRDIAEKELLRLPGDPQEARRQVRELKRAGANGIKAVLETGQAGMLFERMDITVLRAIAEQARSEKLPLVVHTGSAADISDALDAGADGVEHGTYRETIPDELLARMAERRTAYSPTLSVIEALSEIAARSDRLLGRTLVQQVGPRGLLDGTREGLLRGGLPERVARVENWDRALDLAKENLRRAYEAGVPLVAGSDAGNPLVIHGPTVHRELQLWVEAGIPPHVALQAATHNAAILLRAENRIGSIRPGNDADLLLVNGNPLDDISATERISLVVFKGERIKRSALFQQK